MPSQWEDGPVLCASATEMSTEWWVSSGTGWSACRDASAVRLQRCKCACLTDLQDYTSKAVDTIHGYSTTETDVVFMPGGEP
jgi:hypothetical protein